MAENTKFENVFKFFLNSISNDYRIKKIFLINQEVAEDMLTIWLEKSIVKFRGCQQNLEDFDEETKQFNFVLGLTEKVILSALMSLEWMSWNINNITQMNLTLTDNDYNHYAEERNLAGKLGYYESYREIVDQLMIDYQLDKIPIEKWAGA